jgi:hypothetical protein
MRRSALLLVCLLPLVAIALGGARRRPAGPSPYQTVEALKRAVARGNTAAEWATLSPGFKMRLNREAGRTVDVGDYDAFRREQRSDPEMREMERLIATCRVLKVDYDGQGQADVTIKFNKSALLGQSLKVRMIHHALWELWVKGETQPYWGFANSPTHKVYAHKDGSYTVRTLNRQGKVTWQQTFRRDQVVRFHRTTRWYFHNFGKAERQFLGI